MGLIISNLVDVISDLAGSHQDVRILMLGLHHAGKTTILHQLRLHHYVVTTPTIGFNVETVTPCEGLTFTVWDLGGQEKIRELWRHYYHGTEGLFYVVDSTDMERMSECRDQLATILRQDEMCGVPLVVIANKQDQPHALKAAQITERLGLLSLGAQRDWHVQATSAVTGDGICEAMVAMTKFVKKNESSGLLSDYF